MTKHRLKALTWANCRFRKFSCPSRWQRRIPPVSCSGRSCMKPVHLAVSAGSCRSRLPPVAGFRRPLAIPRSCHACCVFPSAAFPECNHALRNSSPAEGCASQIALVRNQLFDAVDVDLQCVGVDGHTLAHDESAQRQHLQRPGEHSCVRVRIDQPPGA